MILDKALDLIPQFLITVKPLIGEVAFTVTKPIDVGVFPDELDKLGGNKNGLYLISAKHNSRVLYVGISKNIPARIYKHIGTEFSWARDGRKASFPNCTLAGQRNWLVAETQEILRNAEFNVTVVFPDPPEISSLLESFIIFWGHQNGCRPEINVEF